MRLGNLSMSNAIEMISSLIVKIKLRDGSECFVTWEAPREAAGLKKARRQPSFYQLRIDMIKISYAAWRARWSSGVGW